MLQETAAQYLKIFFANATDDSVSLDEIYKASNLDLNNQKHNRKWLANKMSPLKRLNLIKPRYKEVKGGPDMLVALEITPEGKRLLQLPIVTTQKSHNLAIAKAKNGSIYPKKTNDDALREALKTIAKLRSDLPDFEINFDIKLKQQ